MLERIMKRVLLFLLFITIVLVPCAGNAQMVYGASGTVIFSSSDGLTGSTVTDGDGGSDDISDIVLQFISGDNYTWTYETPYPSAGNQPVIAAGYAGNLDQHEITIKSSSQSVNFNFISFIVVDSGGTPITVTGYDDNVPQGSVNLDTTQGDFQNTFNQSSGLTASIFDNVDKVVITPQDPGGMWIGINNIQIGDPVGLPTVTTQVVTAIDTTAATGNGNITDLGSNNPTQHGVVWSTSANPTTASSKTTQGGASATGAFTSAITGLTPGTTYHVRAYATNATGTAYGDDVTFKTNKSPVVTTQAVSAITGTTATGNGNVTDLGSPNPDQYGVVWDTSTGPTTALSTKTELGTKSSTGAFVSSITGLSSGTTYYVRAYVTNTVGTVYGNEVSFTTAVAPTVTTQAVSGIGPTIATGNGNITSLGSPNPTQYGVVWDTSANPTVALGTKTEQGSTSSTGAFTSSISGLSPSTTYHVRAYATNAAGTVYGNDVSITTAALPAYTTSAVEATDSPSVGDANAIALTVKKSDNTTDSAFTGLHAVTITGYEAAPDSSYGSFNGVTLEADGSTEVNITFASGEALPALILNKADSQDIIFAIGDVTTPATGTRTITPTHAAAALMVLTQDITAPATNGGLFAQHPSVTLKDAYGNVCTNNSAAEITASKKDVGSWTLTGTSTVTASNGVAAFSGLGTYNEASVTGAQLAFDTDGLSPIASATVNLPAPAANATATAGVATLTPVAGAGNAVTLTIKNTLGITDEAFTDAHNVTISGVEMAPDGSYGSFNGITLTGTSQTVSIDFAFGTATPNLILNKADSQSIGFSIAGVTTPGTNSLTIVPTPEVAAEMVLTQNITAPVSNGGLFAQQPAVTLKDAYGNICANNDATVVTASGYDSGSWTLTGTSTVTANNGVAAFSGLGTYNEASVSGAQLVFNSTGLGAITSAAVNLPAPAGNATATAGAASLTPIAGAGDTITLTVKNTLGITDSSFSGPHDVTISGIEVAPDSSYGIFNGVTVISPSQTVSVIFASGTATPVLKLSKADSQSIGFSIDDVTVPATNNLTLVPTAGTAAAMTLSQGVLAPAANGGLFAQQPRVMLKDAFGNICVSDNSTQVTATRKDSSNWTLTGNATITASSGIVTFGNLGAANDEAVLDAQLAFNSTGMTEITGNLVNLPAPAAADAATAAVATTTPVIGISNTVTLTVKNGLGNTDTTFTGTHNVLISGVEAAPNTTYGLFNGTALTGASQTVAVAFTSGVGTPSLVLNKADAQTISFNISGASNPDTNALTLVPVPGPATSMAVTQEATAPSHNGGTFAQQPRVSLKDAYGNICTNDNSTVIMVSKKDANTWTLTGTATVTASNGIASFSGLGASNSAAISSVLLGYESAGLPLVTGATFDLPAPSSSSGGGGGSSSGTTIPATPTTTPTEVIVNGETQNAGTTTTVMVGERTVTTIAVDDAQVEAKLNSEGAGATVVIPVTTGSDVVVGQLNGQTIKSMEAKEATLEINTGTASYTLPASEINIDMISDQIGSQVALKDILISISISDPSARTAQIIEDTVNKNSYQMVVKPVEFNITCTSGEKTVSVSKFNGYVERTIAIPDGVDPGKITTGIVLNVDGTFSHVPTTIIVIEGKYYAKINSLTNSTYSVIWNEKVFRDVENHWAKDVINDMGSRLVISGVDAETFAPDREITRAEFAAIVVKGLGLMRPGTGKDAYDDVAKGDWYYDAVAIAKEYGIVSGYGEGRFAPNEKITREQAMAMVARAMKITGLKSDIMAGDETKALANFTDASQLADYAKDSAIACTRTGIISGKSISEIAPKANITRAEVASVVRRLLKLSKLI